MPGASSSSISSLETHITLDSPEPYLVTNEEELRLSSLLTLFEKLGCRKHNKQYVSREAKVLLRTW